jgi:cytochrome c oxidase subunit 3
MKKTFQFKQQKSNGKLSFFTIYFLVNKLFNKWIILNDVTAISKSLVKYTLNTQNQKHPFHVISISPWPFFFSFSCFNLILSFLCYIKHISMTIFFLISLISFIFFIFQWFYDIIIEATFEGRHTSYVRQSIKFAFFLFILSEIMFFFSFFWAFFYSSVAPTYNIGGWPPIGIHIINPYKLPLINTLLLLISGACLTCSHFALLVVKENENGILENKNRNIILNFLLLTIFLGLLFLLTQGYEYVHASFTISDSIYGSVFYMCTGLHGLHVLVGLIFLIVCYLRFFFYHFTSKHHIGYELAIWYWHFVDVVWIFLYFSIYIWGA